jgi:protein AFG1
MNGFIGFGSRFGILLFSPGKQGCQSVRWISALPTKISEKDNSPILSKYNSMVENGDLANDEHQREIIQEFERLRDQLTNYVPEPRISPSAQKSSFLARLFSTNQTTDVSSNFIPKGIYLHGTVGCGKTMLMDMFFDSVAIDRKDRVHFHSFMQDFHKSKF